MSAASLLVAPLERVRILVQTKQLTRPEFASLIKNDALSSIKHQSKELGIGSLWRGNAALIYKNTSQLALKLIFFDKFKNYFMPYDCSKYSGF
jgi:hypothetical protein